VKEKQMIIILFYQKLKAYCIDLYFVVIVEIIFEQIVVPLVLVFFDYINNPGREIVL